MRTEYGFTRTICACAECRQKCRHLSGMIAPPDLLRWQRTMGDVFDAWALQSLAASPGAVVRIAGTQEIERIPTLVPARHLLTGACVFLTPQERCGIHDTAPYGCAFFDCMQNTAEGDARVFVALADILYDWDTDGPYSALWMRLYSLGNVVDAPEVGRQALAKQGHQA